MSAAYSEIEYDAEDHPHVCRCGANMAKADGGNPSVSAWVVLATCEVMCSEECATKEAQHHAAPPPDDNE